MEKTQSSSKYDVSTCLYFIFIISYFIHLPERILFLASIRFDLILLNIIFVTIIASSARDKLILSSKDKILTWIYILIIYIIASLPFVKWPGSVIGENIFIFIKAIVFYFFTITIINTENKLKIFIVLFLGCQIFRIIEPVLLHINTGYWGSATYIGQGEFSNRLSGAPDDLINPNGLAFIIVFTITILHFIVKNTNAIYKIFYGALIPVFLYALVLTQSRSGLIGLIIILCGIWFRSRRKIITAIVLSFLMVIIFINLSATYQDRYLSLVESDTRSHSTVEGRFSGWVSGFQVFLDRPIFGHGLGTSLEAEWHVIGNAQIAHNLYLEVLQELGIIGFIIYMGFLAQIFNTFIKIRRIIVIYNKKNVFAMDFVSSMEILFIMQIIFSFASYGFSSYHWYFIAGISSVLYNIYCANNSVKVSSLDYKNATL